MKTIRIHCSEIVKHFVEFDLDEGGQELSILLSRIKRGKEAAVCEEYLDNETISDWGEYRDIEIEVVGQKIPADPVVVPIGAMVKK